MMLLILLLITCISVKVLLITCHTFSILVFVQEFGHQPPEWLKEIASSSGIESNIKLTHSLTHSIP